MTTKPNGAMRICLDPQYLNTQIKREQMMIPNVDEIIAKLKGSNYFSTLDANKGFWMIKLTNNSKNLTTFNTPFGRFYFNRLPFGLASSPEVFHRVFSEIFKDRSGQNKSYSRDERTENSERIIKIFRNDQLCGKIYSQCV